MKIDSVLKQIDEVVQDLINHRDNEPGSDFCKNVDKLINVKNDLILANGSEQTESNCAIPVVRKRAYKKGYKNGFNDGQINQANFDTSRNM